MAFQFMGLSNKAGVVREITSVITTFLACFAVFSWFL
jgi:hypothetical protein